MKVIGIIWRDPQGNLKPEKFSADDFKIKTEPGWLKILGPQGPFRLIPSDKVCTVEFIEEQEESRIAKPEDGIPPLKLRTV